MEIGGRIRDQPLIYYPIIIKNDFISNVTVHSLFNTQDESRQAMTRELPSDKQDPDPIDTFLRNENNQQEDGVLWIKSKSG